MNVCTASKNERFLVLFGEGLYFMNVCTCMTIEWERTRAA